MTAFFISKVIYRRFKQMAASVAVSAFGSTLTWNGVALAELTSITGPSMKVDTIDVTNFTSPDNFREFIVGLIDGGEVGVEGNFITSDTTGQVAMTTDFYARTSRTAVITGPTAAAFSFTFTAVITAFEPIYTMDGALKFTATMKVSSKPVLAITASANLTTLTGVQQQGAAALTWLPTFAGAKYVYNITVDTATTWVKYTPTLAGATYDLYNDTMGTSQLAVASGVESSNSTINSAGTVTTFRVVVKETGKVGKTYFINVYRA
jgi:hypothetical protein